MAVNQYDVAVIGAGIIGLATAMTLLERHPSLRVGILEKDDAVAAQQSGHNSGVVHSGIYYAPGSAKARLCVSGRRAMVKFCREHEIPYREIGKVIVATDESQMPRLHALHERGIANQVEDLRLVDQDELKDLEPYVRGVAALWAPHTGIVDYREVARVMADVIRSRGGEIHLNSRLDTIERHDGLMQLGTGPAEYKTRFIINCAGLHSDRVARLVGADPGLRIIPFRGKYFHLRQDREYLVNHLIYPVPDPAFPFLGVHFTRDIKNRVEAGPNAVLALAREGYRSWDFNLNDMWDTFTHPGFWKMTRRDWRAGVNEIHRSVRKGAFVRDLQQLIPSIARSDLDGGSSGVRAQAVDRDGTLVDDFRIVSTREAVHVLNAPSPGATASLSIGAHIADIADAAFSLN